MGKLNNLGYDVVLVKSRWPNIPTFPIAILTAMVFVGPLIKKVCVYDLQNGSLCLCLTATIAMEEIIPTRCRSFHIFDCK